MKKNHLRLIAMFVCMIMVFAMVPGKANAAALHGKKMPQMNTITYNENMGIHFITEAADLVHIAGVAANDPESYYDCYFDSEEAFTINQNLSLPNNMFFYTFGDLIIAAGVTVTIDGSMNGSSLTVNGTVNVNEQGYLHPGSNLQNNGTINLNGTLGLNEDTTVNGKAINFMEDSWVRVNCHFENGAQLQEIADTAAAMADHGWSYSAYPSSEIIYISNPIVLPYNLDLQLYFTDFQISGAPITINGDLNIDAYGNCVVKNDLILNGSTYLYSWDDEEKSSSITFEGSVTNTGYMDVYARVIFKNKVTNTSYIDVWYEDDASLNFAQGSQYSDEQGTGIIWVNSSDRYFPTAAINGLNVNDFQSNEYWTDWSIPYWALYNYVNSSTPQPPAHEHTPMTLPAVPATCLMNGMSEWVMCATCNETLVEAHELAPLGHDYGLTDDGNIDFYDTTCDVCGAERIVNPTRLTHSMYRMYNPNSGEHFYTGSKEERQTLEAAGWQFEGVGFTFPANTGAPVYRLFQPSTGEHLYTMDEAEVASLLAQGWNNEGVAFNSATSSEVAQYRLHNPNTNVGAYHFTSSLVERDMLLAAGWEDQGIGFYTCMQ